MMDWPEWCETTLVGMRAAIPPPDPDLQFEGGPHVPIADDLLGMCRHPAVRAAARNALLRWGPGLAASAGAELTEELKSRLCEWFRADDVLLTATGAAARELVLSSLASRGVTAYVTETERRQLAPLLPDAVALETFAEGGNVSLPPQESGARSVIFTESVSWQTGAQLPTAQLVGGASSAWALVVVDETFQLLEQPEDLGEALILRTGSLLPLLGVPLGLVAGPAPFIRLLRSTHQGGGSRRFVTAVSAAAAGRGLEIAASPEGTSLRRGLREIVDRVVPGHGSPVFVVPSPSIGAARRCVDRLLALGVCSRAMFLGPNPWDETPTVWMAIGTDASDRQVAEVRATIADQSGSPALGVTR